MSDDATSINTLAGPFGSRISHMLGTHLVATITTLGFIALVAILAFHVVSDSPLMNVMAGALASGFNTVVNFYMGSSYGSAQKTDQVSKLIRDGAGGQQAP